MGAADSSELRVATRGTSELGGAHPHVVDPKRYADLLADEGAEVATLGVGAAHNLTDLPTEDQRLVSAHAACRIERRKALDALNHPIPIAHSLGGDAVGHLGRARLVREDLADGDCRLPIACEFRPTFGDGRVIIDETALRLDMKRDGSEGLGDREDGKQGESVHVAVAALGGAPPPQANAISRPCW
jgi:hypothetical protein